MTEPTDEASETELPPQRRFLLARLAGAVRRQDWFTVLVEIVVVVLGVIIGFQVSTWGQAQSDRARERAYLRQLAAELRETESIIAEEDSVDMVASRSTASLYHAFYQPSPPPADSLTDMLRSSIRIRTPKPVLATLEALVATGDLSLIDNDSLRTAIARYLDGTRSRVEDQSRFATDWGEAVARLLRRVDPNVVTATIPDSVLATMTQHEMFYLPDGPRIEVAPLDRSVFLTDADARGSLYEMLYAKNNLRWIRSAMRKNASSLCQLVENQNGS